MWVDYVMWDECWYNTSHHLTTHKTPFEVIYGRPAPYLVNYEVGTTKNNEVEKELIDEVLAKVKAKLMRA